MRNIFCHEHYIDWRSLVELESYCLNFFKTLENVKECFDLYFENCHSTLPSTAVTRQNIQKKQQPVADIQLRFPCYYKIFGNDLYFCPNDSLCKYFKFTGRQQNNNGKNSLILLSGNSNSGKTTFLKNLFTQSTKKKLVYISCRFFNGDVGQFYEHIISEITNSQERLSVNIQESRESLHKTILNNHLNICFDDSHLLLLKWKHDCFGDFIEDLINFKSCGFWLFSMSTIGDLYFKEYLHNLYTQFKLIYIQQGYPCNHKYLKGL